MRTSLLLSAIVLGLSVLTGCQNEASVDNLRTAISNDLVTYGATQGQVDNQITRTTYLNLRGVNQDWLSLWLLDRPSRMSRYPIE
jgi:hypothetical protein